MLLSEHEEWKLWNAQGIDDMNQAEAIAFARAIEAAILAKLASAEMPSTVWVDVPHFTYTAAQLHEAHAQGFAAGAAAQLSAEPVAETMRDCYPDHSGTIYAEAVLPRGTPLYTRKEAK